MLDYWKIASVEKCSWTESLASFINILSERDKSQFYHALEEDGAGWRVVWGGKHPRRILCLDPLFGKTALALSRNCDCIYTIHFTPSVLRLIRERLDAAAVTNAQCIQIAADGLSLPFSSEYFDCFVLHGIESVFEAWSSRQGNMSAFRNLLREIHRVLRKNAFIYIGLQNKYGYNSLIQFLLRRGQETTRIDWVGYRAVLRSLRLSGFPASQVYPLIVDGDRVLEVVPKSSKYVARNALTCKERVKKFLLQKPFRGFFTPGFGILSFKEPMDQDFCRELLEDLRRKNLLQNDLRQRYVVNRCLVLYKKAILSVGIVGKRYGENIIIIPFDPSVLQRRRHEANILQTLAASDLQMQTLAPRYRAESCLSGQNYIVLSEIPGISIDEPVAQLDTVSRRAAQILIEFHVATCKEKMVDQELFSHLFAKPLNLVAKKLGDQSLLLIKQIEARLWNRLASRCIKTVWTHGDFKIENVLLDPKSWNIVGVIDWDLSEKAGLPVLDLLYLFAYNRFLRQRQELGEITQKYFLSRKFSGYEQLLWEEYIKKLKIEDDYIVSLLVMFWIHHIAYRINIDPSFDNLEEKLNFLKTLRDCC